MFGNENSKNLSGDLYRQFSTYYMYARAMYDNPCLSQHVIFYMVFKIGLKESSSKKYKTRLGYKISLRGLPQWLTSIKEMWNIIYVCTWRVQNQVCIGVTYFSMHQGDIIKNDILVGPLKNKGNNLGQKFDLMIKHIATF